MYGAGIDTLEIPKTEDGFRRWAAVHIANGLTAAGQTSGVDVAWRAVEILDMIEKELKSHG